MPRFDPDALLEVAHLVKHLNPVALAVAYVDQTAVVHHHAMHHAHERAAVTSRGLFLRSLASPLAQEFPILIEHDDAMVAVSIGDVDVPVARIDRDIGRLV